MVCSLFTNWSICWFNYSGHQSNHARFKWESMKTACGRGVLSLALSPWELWFRPVELEHKHTPTERWDNESVYPSAASILGGTGTGQSYYRRCAACLLLMPIKSLFFLFFLNYSIPVNPNLSSNQHENLALVEITRETFDVACKAGHCLWDWDQWGEEEQRETFTSPRWRDKDRRRHRRAGDFTREKAAPPVHKACRFYLVSVI